MLYSWSFYMWDQKLTTSGGTERRTVRQSRYMAAKFSRVGLSNANEAAPDQCSSSVID